MMVANIRIIITGMILFRRIPGLLLREVMVGGCRSGVDMFDFYKKFPGTFKCMSITYGFVAILLSQSVLAQDDAYVEALKQKVEKVNASVNATIESLADAVKNDQVESKAGNGNTPNNPVKPEIARALFTTGVREYEPMNELNELNELKRPREILFFFTELLGMANRQLEHRWYYENEPVGVELIQPKSSRWRVASRVLLEDRLGMWAVEVVDENDEVLLRKEIIYDYGKSI